MMKGATISNKKRLDTVVELEQAAIFIGLLPDRWKLMVALATVMWEFGACSIIAVLFLFSFLLLLSHYLFFLCSLFLSLNWAIFISFICTQWRQWGQWQQPHNFLRKFSGYFVGVFLWARAVALGAWLIIKHIKLIITGKHSCILQLIQLKLIRIMTLTEKQRNRERMVEERNENEATDVNGWRGRQWAVQQTLNDIKCHNVRI